MKRVYTVLPISIFILYGININNSLKDISKPETTAKNSPKFRKVKKKHKTRLPRITVQMPGKKQLHPFTETLKKKFIENKQANRLLKRAASIAIKKQPRDTK